MHARWIRVSGGSAEGDLSCVVGHRLARVDGATDGIYAGWHWDGQALTIEQDRYGMYPLFEWHTADARCVSTDLARLIELGAPADLDFDALAVFLRVGFFVGSDTPFLAIRAVLPPDPPRALHRVSRDAAVDGFIDLFQTAIARRLPSSPYVLPLSGGRDSRHILFALHQAERPPSACVTVRHFPPRSNSDELVAGEVCSRLGISHEVIRQDSNRAHVERRKNAATHSCSDEHAQFVVLSDHLRRRTLETYDGIAGDVLSQSSYLTPVSHAFFERGDIEGFAAFLLDGYGTMMSDGALARLLAPHLYAEVPRERAIARLCRELNRHVNATNPTSSFFLANRTRREVALSPYGLMRDVVVYAPYLDADVYDFLAGLPASVLMDRTLHTEAISRAWPQFAGVPYEERGATTRDRTSGRTLASALATIVRRLGTGWIRPIGLLPGIAATVVDGKAERLWAAPLLFYLDHVAELTSTGSAGIEPR